MPIGLCDCFVWGRSSRETLWGTSLDWEPCLQKGLWLYQTGWDEEYEVADFARVPFVTQHQPKSIEDYMTACWFEWTLVAGYNLDRHKEIVAEKEMLIRLDLRKLQVINHSWEYISYYFSSKLNTFWELERATVTFLIHHNLESRHEGRTRTLKGRGDARAFWSNEKGQWTGIGRR